MTARKARSLYTTMISYIVAALRWFVAFLQSWIQRYTSPTITLDTGRKVRLGRQVAEGGFSFVFEATDCQSNQKYALKRIRCNDPDILRQCRHEAGVHRAVSHPNLMPLLGMNVIQEEAICYMLFPHYPYSLRMEVNRRIIDHTQVSSRPPWNEVVACQIFHGIVQGVNALHEANFSHRDVKLENVLFKDARSRHPVLMDFGSAGPLTEALDTRRTVLTVVEEASIHTTLPYRPPELFEGGIRHGDPNLDYRACDVWSLGCTLFAILYGASPFECEFSRSNGQVKIVECTQLKVIGEIPKPPSHTEPAGWYSEEIKGLIAEMLRQDRQQRPTLPHVMEKLEKHIRGLGGHVQRATKFRDDENDDAGIALMSRNFV